MPKILIVVTGVDTYAKSSIATGLWLSELTHIYHSANQVEYDITIASPAGGSTPVDPESVKPLVLDKLSKAYWNDAAFRNLLQHTKSLSEVAGKEFDLVYLAGGHGTMYDFPDNTVLQHIIKDHYENKKLIAAICHGVGGLLNVQLSDGDYLIRDKTITGFSWFEESLARRKHQVPFNLEKSLKERGADYKKAFIPMSSKVLVAGNLLTGQNPFSSKEMAKAVMDQMKKLKQ